MKNIDRIVGQKDIEMYTEVGDRLVVFRRGGIEVYSNDGELLQSLKGVPVETGPYTQGPTDRFSDFIEGKRVKVSLEAIEDGRISLYDKEYEEYILLEGMRSDKYIGVTIFNRKKSLYEYERFFERNLGEHTYTIYTTSLVMSDGYEGGKSQEGSVDHRISVIVKARNSKGDEVVDTMFNDIRVEKIGVCSTIYIAEESGCIYMYYGIHIDKGGMATMKRKLIATDDKRYTKEKIDSINWHGLDGGTVVSMNVKELVEKDLNELEKSLRMDKAVDTELIRLN
jgi:hypothetical protein